MKVEAWNKEGTTCLGNVEVTKLEKGMYVREIGGLLKVTGRVVEGEDDLYVPVETEDGEILYSILCLDTLPDKTPVAESALEIFSHARETFYDYVNDRTDDNLSALYKAMEIAYDKFKRMKGE